MGGREPEEKEERGHPRSARFTRTRHKTLRTSQFQTNKEIKGKTPGRCRGTGRLSVTGGFVVGWLWLLQVKNLQREPQRGKTYRAPAAATARSQRSRFPGEKALRGDPGFVAFVLMQLQSGEKHSKPFPVNGEEGCTDTPRPGPQPSAMAEWFPVRLLRCCEPGQSTFP